MNMKLLVTSTLIIVSAAIGSSLLAQLDDEFHGRQNTQMNFYGKVVDQEGRPIGDAVANAELVIGQWATSANSPQEPYVYLKRENVTSRTIADGTFALTNLSGHSIEIKSITKPGYKLSQHMKRLFAYSASAAPFHSDPKDPIIFVLWTDGTERSMVSAEKRVNLIPDGRPYALFLEKQIIIPATNSEGDFQFRLLRPNGVGRSSSFDWTFTFQGEEGNVIKRTDHSYFEMALAPTEGFTNLYEEIHKSTDSGWRGVGHKQFYLKVKNGRAYGKATLVWDTVAAVNGPGTNEADIRIQYTVNSNGPVLTP